MLRLRLPGLPRDPMVEARTGYVPRVWVSWLMALANQVDAAAFRLQTVSLTAQGAAITTTAVPIASLTAGLYRVSYALRITRAATTSSSATVTIGWIDGTVTCGQAFAAVTGNTTATVQSGTVLLRCDNDGPITYAVAYASVGATTMQCALDLVVEAVPGVAS
ncbi:MAG: hypothetical protein NTY02_05020 [Acidobacteria bacterium]|nr:hypothetical protein [Acidobacteriota bacterium]